MTDSSLFVATPAYPAYPAHPDQLRRFREAYQAVELELMAIPRKQVVKPNIDPTKAMMATLAALPRLEALAPVMATLPTLDHAQVANLRTYALALGHAQVQVVVASEAGDTIPPLLAEIAATRTRLLDEVKTLVGHRLIPGDGLKRLAGANGRRKLTYDTLALSTMLRDNWSAIQGKTPSTLAQLNHIDALAERLLAALAREEAGALVLETAIDRRRRAFTLLIRAYKEAQRAVQYLRFHEGDADKILPSLFGQDTPRRRRKKAAGEVVKEGETPKAGQESQGEVKAEEAPALHQVAAHVVR